MAVDRTKVLLPQRRAIDPRCSELGALVRSVRESQGLTQVAVAKRLGVSFETISALEAGRPARHSTLHGLLRHIPGLEAHDLLDVEARHAPEANASQWRYFAQACGFRAKKLVVGPKAIEVSGVRPFDADLGDPPVRLALMRAAAVASGSVLRKVNADTREMKDGKHVHRWRVSKGEVNYKRTGPADSSALVELPIEELQLAAPARGKWRLLVTSDVAGDLDLTREVYPLGVAVREGKVRIKHPVVGLRYTLVATDEPLKKRPWSLAATLKKARADAGLTVRALARDAGIALGGIPKLEEGRDAVLSTLQGYLRACPQLLPQEILPGPMANGEVDAEEAWDYSRRLHGLEAKEIIKTIRYEKDGRYTCTIEMTGLKSVRADWRDPKLRLPLVRAVAQSSPDVLRELETDAEDVKIRRRRYRDGAVAHEIRWPQRLASGSATYIRRYESAERHALTAKEAGGKFQLPGPYSSGLTLPVHFATRTVKIVVSLPVDYEPLSFSGHRWPQCFFPDTDIPPLSGGNPPVRITRKGRRLEAVLRVESPLPGLKYGIGWILP